MSRPNGRQRLPPHDLQAEEALLGAALLHNDLIALAAERLAVGDLYTDAHRLIFEAMTTLDTKGEPADPVTVADLLRGSGHLDAVGGPAALVDLHANPGVSSSAPRYIRIIADHARQRDMISRAGELAEAAWDGDIDRIGKKTRALAVLVEEPGDEGDRLLAGLRTGDWLDRQTFPPLRWHVEGLIPEGFSLLVGPPKLGKSWFVLAAGLAISAGGRALGQIKVEQRPVLYLALEDGDRRLQDRSRKLLRGGPIPAGFQYMTKLRPDEVVRAVRLWLARHSDGQPLVMVDTLGKVMPPALNGETTYQRDYRIGSELKQLADDVPGSAVVVNHHDRKAGSDDFVESVSGTNGLAGAADSILLLHRRRMESVGTLRVTGRDVDEAEYALTFRPDEAWQLDGQDLAQAAAKAVERQATEGMSDRTAEIVAYVNQHPKGVKADDVAGALGIDKKQASVYLGRLYESQRIGRPKRGLYNPVGTVGSVGSVTDDQVRGDQQANSSNTPHRAPRSKPKRPGHLRPVDDDAEDLVTRAFGEGVEEVGPDEDSAS